MVADKNLNTKKKPALEPVFALSILCYCGNMAVQHVSVELHLHNIVLICLYIYFSKKKK